MEALQPTFMLLPDFAYLPNKDIGLGTILPASRDSKRPNPRQPLAAALTLIADDISTQKFEPWKWDSDNSLSTSGGVFADLSIITGVGAGIEGSRSHTNGLSIKCDSVVRTTFRPSQASIARATADQTITAILKKLTRPSIYIVTGLMIAHNASIEVKQGKSHSGGAHASVDLTATGAPINTGVKGEVSKGQNSTLMQTPKEDFVLAYQLLRVRRKFDRSLDVGEENRWALFSDDEGEGEGEAGELLEGMDVEMVTEGFQWEE